MSGDEAGADSGARDTTSDAGMEPGAGDATSGARAESGPWGNDW